MPRSGGPLTKLQVISALLLARGYNLRLNVNGPHCRISILEDAVGGSLLAQVHIHGYEIPMERVYTAIGGLCVALGLDLPGLDALVTWDEGAFPA